MTKGEQTRQKIVEKAAALLNQRGFSGFSMSALMEATGLEKGGIYRHFESKEELAAAAFEYAWQAAIGIRMRDLESMANSIEWLKSAHYELCSAPARRAGGGAPCSTWQSMRTTAILYCANLL